MPSAQRAKEGDVRNRTTTTGLATSVVRYRTTFRAVILILLLSVLVGMAMPPTTRAASDGYDAEEQYMLQLINTYRQENNCLPASHDATLQSGAEHWAKNSPAPAQHAPSPDNYGEILTFVTDHAPQGNDAADEGLNWWKSSSPHNAKILTCAYSKVGIGHVWRNGGAFGLGAHYWVARFGGSGGGTITPNATPRLILTGDVGVSNGNIKEEQSQTFTVYVQNIGANLSITEWYVEVITPNGNPWKVSGANQSITSNATATLTASGVIPNHNPAGNLGGWVVSAIAYKDTAGAWRTVESNGKMLNRAFAVRDGTDPVPWLTVPTPGTNFREDHVLMRMEASDEVGATRVGFVLLRPDRTYLDSREDANGGDGWWVDFGSIPEMTGLYIKVHAFDAENNEGISTEYGPFNFDWTGPSISITAPSQVSNELPVTVASLSDAGVGISHLRFFLECPGYNADRTDENPADGWGTVFPTSSIASGTTCRTYVWAFDRATNGRQSNIVEGIQIQRGQLAVGLDATANGSAWRDSAEVQAFVTDNGNGLDRLDCYFNPPGLPYVGYTDRDPSDGWQCRWNISGTPEVSGVRIDAYLWDRVGNVTHSNVIENVFVDRTPPNFGQVSVSQTHFFGVVHATGTFTDALSGVSKVKFLLKHSNQWYESWDYDGSNGWQGSWDIAGVAPTCDAIIIAYPHDRANNYMQTGGISNLCLNQ